MPGLLATFRREWPVLKQAPWSFISVASACLAAGFAAGIVIAPLLHKDGAPLKPTPVATNSATPPVSASPTNATQTGTGNARVGNVQSVGQRGGVTAGTVGSVNQGGSGE